MDSIVPPTVQNTILLKCLFTDYIEPTHAFFNASLKNLVEPTILTNFSCSFSKPITHVSNLSQYLSFLVSSKI